MAEVLRRTASSVIVFLAFASWRSTGGHDVPENVIRRRFGKSLVNFDTLYRPVASTWRMYDGSALGGRPLIAFGRSGRGATIADAAKWAMVQKQIKELA